MVMDGVRPSGRRSQSQLVRVSIFLNGFDKHNTIFLIWGPDRHCETPSPGRGYFAVPAVLAAARGPHLLGRSRDLPRPVKNTF